MVASVPEAGLEVLVYCLPRMRDGSTAGLDELLADRGMTLTAICDALDCSVGDLLVVLP